MDVRIQYLSKSAGCSQVDDHVGIHVSLDARIAVPYHLWIMMTYEPMVFPSPRSRHRVWPVSEKFGKKVMYPNLVIFFITFLYALKAGYITGE